MDSDENAQACEECCALVRPTDMDVHTAWHVRARRQAAAAATEVLRAAREADAGTPAPRHRR